MQDLGLTEPLEWCAGTIRRVPPELSSTIRIGDRVCILRTSLWQSYARAGKDGIALIREGAAFGHASVLPVVVCLSYHQ